MMAKISVDECPAGPAMDAAVAELSDWGYVNSSIWGGWCWRHPDNITGRYYESPPSFSTDIAMAWELAEFKGLALVPQSKGDGFRWLALDLERVIYSGDITLVEKDGTAYGAETAPLAICRAFLKANGVEYIEVPE